MMMISGGTQPDSGLAPIYASDSDHDDMMGHRDGTPRDSARAPARDSDRWHGDSESDGASDSDVRVGLPFTGPGHQQTRIRLQAASLLRAGIP